MAKEIKRMGRWLGIALALGLISVAAPQASAQYYAAAVENLQAVAQPDGTVKVSFNFPTKRSDGVIPSSDTPWSGVAVQRSLGQYGERTNLVYTSYGEAFGKGEEYSIIDYSALEPGETYYYWAAAAYNWNMGEFVSTAYDVPSVTLPSYTPDAPEIVSLEFGITSATIKVKAPATGKDDGGNGVSLDLVSKIELFYCMAPDGLFEKVAEAKDPVPGAQVELKHSCGNLGRDGYYYAVASYGKNAGSASETKSLYLGDLPTAPVIQSVKRESDGVKIVLNLSNTTVGGGTWIYGWNSYAVYRSEGLDGEKILVYQAPDGSYKATRYDSSSGQEVAIEYSVNDTDELAYGSIYYYWATCQYNPGDTKWGPYAYSVLADSEPVAPAGLQLPLISDMIAKYDREAGQAYVSFTLPEKGSIEGEDYPLPTVSKVQLLRKSNSEGNEDASLVAVATLGAMEPGSAVTLYDETSVKGGSYTYQVAYYYGEARGVSNLSSVDLYRKLPRLTGLSALPTGEKGAGPLKVSFTIPETDSDGELLQKGDIESIAVQRNGMGVVTYDGQAYYISQPEPGRTYEFVEPKWSETDLRMQYSFFVFAEGGGQAYEAQYVWGKIGNDIPDAPTALQWEETGSTLHLSWDAVTTGQDNGYVNASLIRYSVKVNRGGEELFYKTLIREPQVDVDLSMLTEPTEVTVTVTSLLELQTGGSLIADKIKVGPAYGLPFEEDFSRAAGYAMYSRYKWDSTGPYVQRKSFYVLGDDDVEFYAREEGDTAPADLVEARGMMGMYFFASDAGESHTVESQKISLGEAVNPWLTFYVYEVPRETGSTSTVSLEIIENNNNTTSNDADVYNAFATGEKYGWKVQAVDLGSLRGSDNLRLRYTLTPGGVAAPVFFDDVTVDDYPGVTDLKGALTEDASAVSLEWTSPSGDKPVGYELYVNGEKDSFVASTQTLYTPKVQNGELAFSVKARYAVDAIEVPMSNEVRVDLSGIGQIAGENCDVALADGRIECANPAGILVRVCSVAGTLYYCGSDSHVYLEVPSGTYIVTAGTKAVKVIVK